MLGIGSLLSAGIYFLGRHTSGSLLQKVDSRRFACMSVNNSLLAFTDLTETCDFDA
jgi:hypothetical protein